MAERSKLVNQTSSVAWTVSKSKSDSISPPKPRVDRTAIAMDLAAGMAHFLRSDRENR